MIGRRKRSMSQRTYQVLQAIHAENDRLKQIDRGLGYGHATPAPRSRQRIGQGTITEPLHVGPVIDAVRNEDGWAA